VGDCANHQFRRRIELPAVEVQTFAAHGVQCLRELDRVDVVGAGRLGAWTQRLVIAAEAQNAADSQGGTPQSIALERNAVAITSHHGQHRRVAFRGQDGGTRQR